MMVHTIKEQLKKSPYIDVLIASYIYIYTVQNENIIITKTKNSCNLFILAPYLCFQGFLGSKDKKN